MYFETSDILRITEDVWTCMLGLEVQPVAPHHETPADAHALTGRIFIHGAWEGCVTMRSSVDMVRRAASILMGVELEQTTKAEIHDTLGELTNMIAGNIKGLLPGPTQLSLPKVEEEEASARECRQVYRHLEMNCDGQPLWISVLVRG